MYASAPRSHSSVTMRRTWALTFCCAVAVVAAAGAYGAWVVGAADSALVVKLKAKNYAGVSGTATLARAGKNIRVVVKLSRSVPGRLPAHLHIGPCSIERNISVREGLNNVVKGTSVTITSTTWATLRKARHSIHVHKPGYTGAVIACGDVPRTP